MKTIYSLKEFRNEVLALAALKNENYTSVGVEVNYAGVVTFKAYIPNGPWHSGETPEECLQKLKDQITTPPIKDIDVEIEMPVF